LTYAVNEAYFKKPGHRQMLRSASRDDSLASTLSNSLKHYTLQDWTN